MQTTPRLKPCKLEAAVGWMQMMPFSMEQVVRYHSFWSDWASASWNLGLVLDWPRLHFLHCVAIDYVCCGCMQEMNTKCVHIKLIKLIKRFVLESRSFLYSIASHVSRFKSIPSLTQRWKAFLLTVQQSNATLTCIILLSCDSARLEIQHPSDPFCKGQRYLKYLNFHIPAVSHLHIVFIQVETLHLNTAGEITEEDCQILNRSATFSFFLQMQHIG